ncbi:hypothetical protein IJV79_02010 [bacterium]|nr:hypothetical protein [bacterium]
MVSLNNGTAFKIGWNAQDYSFYLDPGSKVYSAVNTFIYGLYPKGASEERYEHFVNKGLEPYIVPGSSLSSISNGTSTNSSNALAIIQANGWKIPDNYSWDY